LEVRLKDRLEHQLERRLHHTVPHGRDPKHPQLAAAGLGDQPLPHGQRAKRARSQVGTQLGEERLLAAPLLDVVGRLAVHPSGTRPLVPLDPAPCHQQHRRVTDEVEQVSKPATGIVGCPSVQLGLDPQYPRLRLLDRKHRPRCAGVHRRPPGLPAPPLRACCPPSPCGRLSRPRTTTGTPPRPATPSRRRACPPPAWLAGGKGGRRAVPTFTMSRLTGSAPSYSPAASPRVRRSPSPWPPSRPSDSLLESRPPAAG
jgi:hypothetical protein